MEAVEGRRVAKSGTKQFILGMSLPSKETRIHGKKKRARSRLLSRARLMRLPNNFQMAGHVGLKHDARDLP
jgi:hypothetical protein